jgi:hypothetical protein
MHFVGEYKIAGLETGKLNPNSSYTIPPYTQTIPTIPYIPFPSLPLPVTYIVDVIPNKNQSNITLIFIYRNDFIDLKIKMYIYLNMKPSMI